MHISFDVRAQASHETRTMRRLIIAPRTRNLFSGAGVTFAIVFCIAFPFIMS